MRFFKENNYNHDDRDIEICLIHMNEIYVESVKMFEKHYQVKINLIVETLPFCFFLYSFFSLLTPNSLMEA